MKKILLFLFALFTLCVSTYAQIEKRILPPIEMPSMSFVIKYGIDRSKGQDNKKYINDVKYVFIYKEYVAFRNKDKNDWKVVYFDPKATEASEDEITFYNIKEEQAVFISPKNKVPSVMFFDEKKHVNISFHIDIEETNRFLEYLKED